MPSKSKAQQRFFGVVKGIQKGSAKGSGKAKKAARDMSPADVDDFASTKHKGLPNRVKQETKVRQLIRKMVREIMREGGPGSGPHKDEDNPFDREPSDDELADIEKEYEGVEEGFAGALKEKDRKSFDKIRRKQSEVLGYKLTGTDDIRSDIGDATIHEGLKRFSVYVSGQSEPLVLMGKNEKEVKQTAHMMLKNSSIKIRKVIKEGKLTEDFKNNKWEVYIADENRREKIVKVAKSKRAAVILYNKLIKTDKYHEVGMRVIKEGKLTEAKEPLWTKETVQDAIKQIKKGLKNAVPYLDGIGTGFGGESIIGKISLDDKKTWSNNILENSRWALIHFFPDGTLDTIRMNGYSSYETRKKVPILRKSKNKNLKQAIDRMGRYFTVVRTKHPDK